MKTGVCYNKDKLFRCTNNLVRKKAPPERSLDDCYALGETCLLYPFINIQDSEQDSG
jgi:hypothetical protein